MFSEDELKYYEQVFNPIRHNNSRRAKTSAGVYILNRYNHI